MRSGRRRGGAVKQVKVDRSRARAWPERWLPFHAIVDYYRWPTWRRRDRWAPPQLWWAQALAMTMQGRQAGSRRAGGYVHRCSLADVGRASRCTDQDSCRCNARPCTHCSVVRQPHQNEIPQCFWIAYAFGASDLDELATQSGLELFIGGIFDRRISTPDCGAGAVRALSRISKSSGSNEAITPP
jgi:hypothetical protein